MRKEQERDEFINKRVARQKKLRKRRLKIFFVMLIIFLLILSVSLSLTVFFPIEKITASGSKVYESNKIINASGIEKGENLFAISRTETLKKLKEKLPYIETVEFKRSLPGSIEIKVTDAEEYAYIFKNNKYYTVSQSGWVLSESEMPENKLFVIRGADVECKVSSRLEYKNEEQLTYLKRITDSLKSNKISVNFIDISDNLNLQIGVENRFEVVIGSSNNIEEKIKHLGSMIEKISAEKQGKIDLSMWTVDNLSATFVEKNDK